MTKSESDCLKPPLNIINRKKAELIGEIVIVACMLTVLSGFVTMVCSKGITIAQKAKNIFTFNFTFCGFFFLFFEKTIVKHNRHGRACAVANVHN